MLGSGYSANPFVDASFDVGRIYVDLQTTSVSPVSDPMAIVRPDPRAFPSDGRGLLIGGYETRTNPSYYYESKQGPTTVRSVTAVLRLDGHAPQVLPVRLVPGNEHFNQASLAIPDVDAQGVLELTIDWNDGCFHFVASGRTAVTIVSTAVTGACSMEADAFSEDLTSDLVPFSVGTNPVTLFAPFVEARYLPVGNPGIDAFAVYAWDPDAPPVAAAADSVLQVSEGSPDLELTTMESVVWTRRSVVDARKDYPPKALDLVLRRTPARQPDGSFRFRVPAEPGKYVASFDFQFETNCATGRAWAVFSITVVEPAPSATTPPSLAP